MDGDCILYVNRMNAARTCWLHRQKGTGRLRTHMMVGFEAEAPEGWHERN